MAKSNVLDRFIHASLWTAGTSYLFFAFNFLGQIVLARILFPQDFGVFAFVTSLVELVAVFLGFSTTVAFINTDGKQSDYNASIQLNMIAGLAYMVVALAGFFILKHWYVLIDAWIFLILCLAQIPRLFSNVFLAPLEKALNYKVVSLVRGLTTSSALVLGISYAFYFHSVWALVLREVLAALFLIVCAFYLGTFRYQSGLKGVNIRPQFQFGIKTSISRGLETLYYRFPDILIQAFLGKAALGSFYQARYLSYFPIKLMEPFTHQVLFSFFSNLKDDKALLSKQLSWINYLIVRILLPFCFFVFLFGKDLVVYVYGPHWELAGEYFRYFSFFMLFFPLYSSLLSACYSLSFQKIISEGYFLAVLIFVSSVALFHYAEYAALVFSLGLTSAYIYALLRLRFYAVSIPLRRTFLLPALTSGFAFLPHFFGLRRLAVFGLFLALYGVLLFIERKQFKQVVRRILDIRGRV